MSYSACYQTASINLGCASNVGGIVRAYLVADTLTGATYNGDGELTAIVGAGGNIYTYDVQKQTSSLTETINSSLENGTLFYQQDLTLVFHKIDADKRNQVKLMAQNRGLMCFVEDNNGTIYFLGNPTGTALSGGYLSAGSAATGTAFGDSNQYSVTLSFFSADPMVLLADTLANTVSASTINP